MGQCLGQAGDGQIDGRRPVHDRRHDNRGYEGERSQKANVALTKGFAIGNFDEGRDTAEPEIFDPPESLGDGGEESIAGFGTHSGPRDGDGLMHDAFHGAEVWSRPRQREHGRG
jgi:hypothetical protein